MGLIDKLFKSKNPLKDIDPNELDVENIRLEREEKLKSADVQKLAKKKKDLFEKGFNANKTDQRTLARKIKETDRDIKLKERHLKTISNQILAVNNMKYIHEQKEILQSSGVIGKLSKLSKQDLNKMLGEINLEQKVMESGVEGINTLFDTEFGLDGEMLEDDETQGLMDVWSSATEEDSDEEFSQWENRKENSDEELDFN